MFLYAITLVYAFKKNQLPELEPHFLNEILFDAAEDKFFNWKMW